jgi:hypothetical protein
MSKLIVGLVLGIALATWGVDGTMRIVSNGINKIQDGARVVEQKANN